MTHDDVHDLLDAYLAKRRSGEAPNVEDYLATHTEHSAELRPLLEAAIAMDELAGERVSENSRGDLAKGSVFGDFRVVREIGRGGMGIVYEAEQLSLGRRVALKVLSTTIVDARQIERFRREARVAAQLHHTNIVPVFGSGEHDGRLYSVMQLVEGESVADALARGRFADASWSELSDIARQVAAAIAYAHDNGTLHRDIKPSNLLLDKGGIVRVADFGLARAVEDHGLTKSGDVVGTLRYMAPEQLRGRAEARTDIYALGLTLYELTTGRAAFEQSTEGLVDEIRESRVDRPRKVRSEIPRDLETIILRCLAPDPAHRYEDASALETDLERFRENRPILARRVSSLESTWRWAQRNRRLASAIVVAILALCAASIVGWVAFGITNRALDDAREATTRAESNLQLGKSALDAIFARVVGSPIDYVGDGEDDEEASESEVTSFVSEREIVLLQELLAFYDEFAKRNSEDDTGRLDAARAYRRVGQIQLSLRNLRDAQAAFRNALKRYQSVQTGVSAEQRDLEIATTWNDLGVSLARTIMGPRGPMVGNRSHEQHERAIELLEGTPNPQAKLELARSYDLLGSTMRRRGRIGRMRGRGVGMASTARRTALHEKSLAIANELLSTDPKKRAYREACARSHRMLASSTRDSRAAQQHLDESIRLYEQLAKDAPEVARYAYALVETCVFLSMRRANSSGERMLARAWPAALQLVERHPEPSAHLQMFLTIVFRRAGADLFGFEYGRLRRIVQRTQSDARPSHALTTYATAAEALRRRSAPAGEDAAWLAALHLNLVKLYEESGDKESAARTLAQSRAIQERVAQTSRTPSRQQAILRAHDELK